jgi:hypothetical protein
MRKTKEGREQYRIRYNSAKSAADLLNKTVGEIEKIVGVKLTSRQIESLAGQFRGFDSLVDRANETYERYEDFCIRFDYVQKDIETVI